MSICFSKLKIGSLRLQTAEVLHLRIRLDIKLLTFGLAGANTIHFGHQNAVVIFVLLNAYPWKVWQINRLESNAHKLQNLGKHKN